MGMGNAKLIHGNGNRNGNGNGLMGMGGNENSTFSISSQRKRSSPSVVLHQLLRELWRTVTHSTVIAHQLRSAVSSTLRISAAQKTIHSRQSLELAEYVNLNGNGSGRE